MGEKIDPKIRKKIRRVSYIIMEVLIIITTVVTIFLKKVYDINILSQIIILISIQIFVFIIMNLNRKS
jgi:hypothetical protein